MSKTKLEMWKIRWKRYVPLILPISLAAACLTLIVHLTARVSPVFADVVNRYYGGILREHVYGQKRRNRAPVVRC